MCTYTEFPKVDWDISKTYKRVSAVRFTVNMSSLLRLRATIIGTLAIIISLSTLFFTIILTLTGTFNISFLIFFVVGFNILQWLIAPYLVDAIYRIRPISQQENPQLYNTVNELSRKSGIKMPRLMLARIPIPNAFAYGSPIAGNRVAVTEGLVKNLEKEEVEAVIGHELGHLKHRDVQVMMFVSILPSIFYFIGSSLIFSSMLGGGRRRNGGGSATAVIGIVSLLLYFILTLFTLHLSRLREYYADRHSASVVEDGPRKLSEGLAKIVHASRRSRGRTPRSSQLNSFKALFISDPDRATSDAKAMAQIGVSDQALVDKVLHRKVSGLDRFLELLSTHPNIVKRLRALQRLG